MIPCASRLGCVAELEGHSGCVNRLVWSANGDLLASVSDDCTLRLWQFSPGNTWMRPLSCSPTGHSRNVFGVRFMPQSDNKFVTGAMDGEVRLQDLSCGATGSRLLSRERSIITYVDVAPDSPYLIWSASEAGFIRQFDIRESPKSGGNEGGAIVLTQRLDSNSDLTRRRDHASVPCKSVRINPTNPFQFVVACGDSYARMYDRRRLPPLNDLLGSSASSENVLFFAPLHCASESESWQPSHALENFRQRTGARDTAVASLAEHNGSRRAGRLGSTYAEFDATGRSLLVAYEGCDGVFTFDLHAAISAPSDLPPLALPTQLNAGEPLLAQAHAAASQWRSTWRPTSHAPHFSAPVETLKQRGNDSLIAKRLSEAALIYSSAIALAEEEVEGMRAETRGPCRKHRGPRVATTNAHGIATLRCNRALALLRRSWPGDAADAALDCFIAVRLSPGFLKSHVRLAKAFHDCGHSFAAADNLARLLHDATETSPTSSLRLGDSGVMGEILGEARRLLMTIDKHILAGCSKGKDRDACTPSSIHADPAAKQRSSAASATDAAPRVERPCVEMESGLLRSPFPHYPWTCSADAAPRSGSRHLMSLCHRDRFVGGANSMTGIKEAAFWDCDAISNAGSLWPVRGCHKRGFIVAGSDCGHALVFDRRSTALVCALKADVDVVNCVRPHPTLPLLATSGIENTIRLWAPRHAYDGGGTGPDESRTPLQGPSAPPRIPARATTDQARLAKVIERNCSTDGKDNDDSDVEGAAASQHLLRIPAALRGRLEQYLVELGIASSTRAPQQ